MKPATITNKPLTFSAGLSQFIQLLYQEASAKPQQEFKAWVFIHLQQLVAFDSGLWVVANRTEDTFLYNQPEAFKQCAYAEGMNGEFEDVKCQIASITEIENQGSCHKLCFFRQNVDDIFTIEQIQLLQFVLPSLIEACRINLLGSLKQGWRNRPVIRAITDHSGEIIESEAGFTTLMSTLGLLKGNKISVTLNSDNQPISLTIKDHSIQLSLINEQIHFAVGEGVDTYCLSTRQKEVCRLLATGLTDKLIGKELGISHHTVSNHLKDIYKLLNVGCRPAAVASLSKLVF